MTRRERQNVGAHAVPLSGTASARSLVWACSGRFTYLVLYSQFSPASAPQSPAVRSTMTATDI